MKNVSRLLVCSLALLIASPLFAEDAKPKKEKPVKGRGVAAGMLNKLDALELSADQKSKVEAAAKELNSTMMTLRKEGIADLTKQKAEAMKKAREEGKKGKDLEATVMASLNLSDDQQALLKKAAEAQTKFQKVVAETLTAEQLTALPQQLQQQLKRAKGEGKGPKKKKAA
jgi:hypothetical protein